jgi:hypothetical protein
MSVTRTGSHPGEAPDRPVRGEDSGAEFLDELRRSEFARLDAGGHVYLDYTGGGLYAESQLREHFELLRGGVFGNPHSLNPTSAASTELVERARARVLDFFRASPDEYVAIFTANATGALRLVGEAYPFRSGDRFLLTFDNHNSVNGIREFARARNAETTYVPSVLPDLRVRPTRRRNDAQPSRPRALQPEGDALSPCRAAVSNAPQQKSHTIPPTPTTPGGAPRTRPANPTLTRAISVPAQTVPKPC